MPKLTKNNLISILNNHIIDYPTQINLNYFCNFGFLQICNDTNTSVYFYQYITLHYSDSYMLEIMDVIRHLYKWSIPFLLLFIYKYFVVYRQSLQDVSYFFINGVLRVTFYLGAKWVFWA